MLLLIDSQEMRLNHGEIAKRSSARFSGRFHSISLVYHEIPSWHGNSSAFDLASPYALYFHLYASHNTLAERVMVMPR
jgi:hypothetical protein